MRFLPDEPPLVVLARLLNAQLLAQGVPGGRTPDQNDRMRGREEGNLPGPSTGLAPYYTPTKRQRPRVWRANDVPWDERPRGA